MRETRGSPKGQRDAGDAGRPSGVVEHLSENPGADKAAGEVAGEIDTARRAAIRGGGAADEAGCRRLGEERSDPDQYHAGEHGREVAIRRSGSPTPASPNPDHMVGRVPILATAHPASRVVTIDGRNTKYTNPSSIGPSDNGGRARTKLTKVNVPMKAKRMQKPMPKAARSRALRR